MTWQTRPGSTGDQMISKLNQNFSGSTYILLRELWGCKIDKNCSRLNSINKIDKKELLINLFLFEDDSLCVNLQQFVPRDTYTTSQQKNRGLLNLPERGRITKANRQDPDNFPYKMRLLACYIFIDLFLLSFSLLLFASRTPWERGSRWCASWNDAHHRAKMSKMMRVIC